MKHIKEIISYLNNQEGTLFYVMYGLGIVFILPVVIILLLCLIGLLAFGFLFPFVSILFLFGAVSIKSLLISFFFFLVCIYLNLI